MDVIRSGSRGHKILSIRSLIIESAGEPLPDRYPQILRVSSNQEPGVSLPCGSLDHRYDSDIEGYENSRRSHPELFVQRGRSNCI
jgi:hypothetical protein